MAKASGGKKKATIWYDRVTENHKGEAYFIKVQRPVGKKQRRGF